MIYQGRIQEYRLGRHESNLDFAEGHSFRSNSPIRATFNNETSLLLYKFCVWSIKVTEWTFPEKSPLRITEFQWGLNFVVSEIISATGMGGSTAFWKYPIQLLLFYSFFWNIIAFIVRNNHFYRTISLKYNSWRVDLIDFTQSIKYTQSWA